MKNKYLVTLSLLALLTSCGNNSTTTSPSNTNSATSTSTKTSEKTSDSSTKSDSTSTKSDTSTNSNSNTNTNTDSPSVNPQPTVKSFDISELKKGYTADITLNDDGSYDVYKVGIGDDVLTFKEYYGKNERKLGWNDTNIAISKAYSYEPVTKDGDTKSYLGYAAYDLNGNVVKNVIDIYDSTTSSRSPIEWQYADADNFFSSLENDDFTKNGDGTYSLNFTKDSVSALKSKIITQIYPGNDSNYGKYTSYTLNSYTLNVDEDLKPTSFNCSVTGDDAYGYGESTYTFEGTFTSIGENSATQLQQLQGDADLETALAKLKAQNYRFQVFKRLPGDGWYNDPMTHFSNGYVDGTTVIYTIDEKDTGYTKVDDNHYRKFDVSKKIYESAISTDGNMFADILSAFDFNSTIFKKISNKTTTDGVDVYTIGYNDFAINNSTKTYTSIYMPKYVSGLNSALTSSLKVIVSDDQIEFSFQDTEDNRVITATYYDFGNVSTYDVSKITEPATEGE